MKLHWQILVALGLGVKRNWHIFFALLAGITVGIMFPIVNGQQTFFHEVLSFAGQAFINLIQMVVIPLIVSAIIVGIASLGDSKQLGKIGARMLLYYILIATIAVSIGAGLSLAFKPGKNVAATINQQQAETVREQVAHIQTDKTNLSQMYLNMIPKNPIESLAKAELVPIIVFVIIFGTALAMIGDLSRPVVSFFESTFAATMRVTDWIMVLATPGIFALTAFTVG
ncbi:MAG TPA: hypothetical protein DDX14_04310, partial [Cyanobacteria bacterium UBA9579]|nr:hypothetical protein [Cyanobacteria bacterium UBA9579]